MGHAGAIGVEAIAADPAILGDMGDVRKENGLATRLRDGVH
jgi:hypothetical protein